MSEQPELSRLFEAATDRAEPAGLAEPAWRTARQRRTRRAAAAGAGSTAAVLVAVVLLTQGGGPASVAPPVADSPSGSPTAHGEVSEDVEPVRAPPIPDGVIQEQWDPFTVAEEPLRPSTLSGRLEPPLDPPALSEAPLAAAVLAWPEEDQDLRLLGTDGSWRSVPDTADVLDETLLPVVDPALSADGRQVAMAVPDGILVVEVTSGEARLIGWRAPIAEPWDTAPELRWLPDGAGFAVLHWKGTFLVGFDGSVQRAPYGGSFGSGLAVDPDGPVVERRDGELRVWQGEELTSRVQGLRRVQGDRYVTGDGRLAFTGGFLRQYSSRGPMVLDTATGELVGYVPIRDPAAVYSDNGYLSTLGFLDADTVLLLVGPMDFSTMDPGEETRHLLAWHLETGEFERIASGPSAMARVEVAVDVLAAGL